MTWQEAGKKMQEAVVDKIWRKIQNDGKLTGFERSFYGVETGDFDYSYGWDEGEIYQGHIRE